MSRQITLGRPAPRTFGLFLAILLLAVASGSPWESVYGLSVRGFRVDGLYTLASAVACLLLLPLRRFRLASFGMAVLGWISVMIAIADLDTYWAVGVPLTLLAGMVIAILAPIRETVLRSSVLAGLIALFVTAPMLFPAGPHAAYSHVHARPVDPAVRKIRHIVIIVQENRSFDEYFGTYPGADGLPRGVCTPDPKAGKCAAPYPDHQDRNVGGPHSASSARNQIDNGRMDGFLADAESGVIGCLKADPNAPDCSSSAPDVMGYHTSSDIPNYWAYAKAFVLQDRLFAANLGWSLPAHLFAVSGWAATCPTSSPMRCHTNLSVQSKAFVETEAPYAWTDITRILQQHHVPWRYYVSHGEQPDCADGAVTCPSSPLSAGTPSIWNPLPRFVTVREDHQLGNIQDSRMFFRDARDGTLPAVSWVIPNQANSEHPPALVSDGQAWVTKVVNAVMTSPSWDSSAIFVSWDDWGGFYDHVVPPQVDSNGYGLRVPGLMISPYARRGYVDHQVLSPDAYLKFIEDIFLDGQRLDPATDGRPDSRPTVRENVPALGDLIREFDFSQAPRSPLVLPERPQSTLIPPG